MAGFRIVCDLSDILDGMRKKSFLYVELENDLTIRDLCNRIKTSFDIQLCIALLINDVFLPFEENLKILHAGDVVKVVLLQSKSKKARNGISAPHYTLAPEAGYTNELTQRDGEPIHTVDNTLENISRVGDDIAIQNGSPSVKKEKKKRKHEKKRKHSEVLEASDLQESTAVISEIYSEDKQTCQLEKDEFTAVTTTGETEPSATPKKRKRIRCRKKKSIVSDIVPPVSYNQQSFAYNASPMPPHYERFIADANKKNNLLHIRFSSDTSYEIQALENETTLPNIQKKTVAPEFSNKENVAEMYMMNNLSSKALVPGNSTPLVVRRNKTDHHQSVEAQPVEAIKTFLQKPPEIDDIITFKIWKMDQNYCPEISGIIKAKVLNFCSDTQQVTFLILEGKHHCQQPVGKFSLEMDFIEDHSLKTMPDIMELNWQEMLEVEIFL